MDHLRPGTTIHRRIRLTSTSSSPQRLSLYAAAASVGKERFVFARDRTPNELSTWASFDRPTVTLPPRGGATVRATIKVPKTASEGERYAVLWAEDASAGEGTVRMVNRVGVRVYLDVGAGGEARSDFRISSMTPLRGAGGRPVVRIEVRNTGGRALDMNGTLALAGGPGGLGAGPFRVPQGVSVEPGGTATLRVPLDARLPAGPWNVTVALGSGMVRHTQSGRLTFPDHGTGRPVTLRAKLVSAPGTTTAAVLALLAAVLGGSVLVLRFLIRRRA